jgi:heptosyltransferase-1
MGDVIHTLPALTDAARAIPGIRFDWVVEEGFEEIPSWHPAVDKVIKVAIRRWRKNIFTSLRGSEWKQVRNQLKQCHYDCVIDAQGLLKSAWLTRYTKAPVFGYDSQSARERFASFAYQHKLSVPKEMHAVERTRSLFAQALNYKLPQEKGSYGIDKKRFTLSGEVEKNLVFLHGTSRDDKHWPEPYWCELASLAGAAGFHIYLPWGSDAEKQRAERIAANCSAAEVLPKLTLYGVASVLARANGVVAVDTGLGHLTAALDIPAVSLYGPTSPDLVGAYGHHQVHLTTAGRAQVAGVEPVAMAPLLPADVWRAMSELLEPSA